MIRVKDIVKITCDYPSGTYDTNTKNLVGIVTNIWNTGKELAYQICTESTEFWYSETEFTFATEEDLKNELVRILAKKSENSKDLEYV